MRSYLLGPRRLRYETEATNLVSACSRLPRLLLPKAVAELVSAEARMHL
jgi:hypothetical protein